MHKISYIKFYIKQAAKARIAFAALGAFCLVACSSETSEEVKEIIEQNPMLFSSYSMTEEQDQTRASVSLQDGFRVWCWKKFALSGQQIVMDQYQVNYNADAANKWSYEGVSGQYLKYWDLAGYPYEFRAVTPYTANATFTQSGLTVDLSAAASKTFKAQTFLEESLNQNVANSEPCLIAQVSRTQSGSDYVDKDVLTDQEINATNKTNATRAVNLPFHHLLSKVGFRFYVDLAETPIEDVILSSVEISIKSAQSGGKIVTQSKLYSATNTDGLLHGTFGMLTDTEGSFKLLTHSSAYSEKMNAHNNKNTAFNLLLDNEDLLQIPQKDFNIHVKLVLNYKGNFVPYDADIYSGQTYADANYKFTWLPNTHYIYYLYMTSLEKTPIVLCTSEIVPWEVINTSDIVVGL